MPDLNDGESVEMKGSGAKPYVLKNVGGVYSCTCPAWRNQSIAHRAPHLQAPAQAPRRRGRGGPGRRGAPAQARGDRRGRRGRHGRPAAAAGRALGQRRRPGRLVDEREARRRPRLLGRPGSSSRAWATCSTPPTGSSPGCRTCRSTASCGSAARRSSATVSIVRRQDKSDLWKEVPFVVFDAPALDGRSRTGWRSSATTSSGTGRRTLRAARARRRAAGWTTCGPSWRGSRRWAARG